jgi:hypothetical protein
MTDEEHQLLDALVGMVVQYLAEVRDDTEVFDSMSMSAGEDALAVLAKYGFVEVDEVGRAAVWTEAGQRFLNSS